MIVYNYSMIQDGGSYETVQSDDQKRTHGAEGRT